jgi:hypothetical protein
MIAVSQNGQQMVEHRTAIWPNTERDGNGGKDERWLLHVRKIHELGSVVS